MNLSAFHFMHRFANILLREVPRNNKSLGIRYFLSNYKRFSGDVYNELPNSHDRNTKLISLINYILFFQYCCSY